MSIVPELMRPAWSGSSRAVRSTRAFWVIQASEPKNPRTSNIPLMAQTIEFLEILETNGFMDFSWGNESSSPERGLAWSREVNLLHFV